MWSKWSENKKVTLLMLMAVVMTALVWIKTEAVNDDGIRYIHCAQFIQAGDWKQAVDHEKMPFVPALICLAHMVVGDWVLAGRLVATLANLLLLLPFYALCRRLWGGDKAFVSALFLAAAPYFRTVDIMRDPVFLLWMACFLYFWCRADESKRLRYHVAMFCCALLATLSRIEGAFLVLTCMIYLAWLGLTASSRRTRVMTAVAICVFTLAGALAVFSGKSDAYRVNRINELTIIVRHPVHYYETLTIHRLRDRLQQMQPEFRDGKGGLLDTARNLFWLIYLIGLGSVLLETTFPVMFFLSLLGLYAERPWTGMTKKLLLLLAVFLLIPYIFLVRENFLSGRYLCPASLILYLWVGPGFFCLWQAVRARCPAGDRWLVVVLLLLLAVPVFKIAASRSGREKNIVAAGIWVERNKAPGDSVVTNDMKILFYADIMFHHERCRLTLKDADWQTLRQRAQEQNARWIVYKSKAGVEVPPGYVELFPGRRAVAVYKVE